MWIKRRHFLQLSVLFLASCSATHYLGKSTPKIPPLKFTVTDAKDLAELRQDYEAFRLALAQVLKTTLEFSPVDNFIAAAPAMLAGNLDLAWAGPSEYLILRSRAQAIPLVAITRPGYYPIIVVRRDSGITSLAQLKGKKIAMRSEGSTGGHIGPLKLLLDAGLQPQKDFQIVMVGSRGMEALKNKEVDASAQSTFFYESFLESNNIPTDEFPILVQGPPLPNDVLAVSPLLEPEIIQAIQEQILNHPDQLIKAILSSPPLKERFVGAQLTLAQDTDYDLIREVYQAIGQGSILQ